MYKIRFKSRIYYLIGDMQEGGAIATKRQYENGLMSYVHLFSDGRIMRFGEAIGRKEDITILGTAELKPKVSVLDLWDNFLNDPYCFLRRRLKL